MNSAKHQTSILISWYTELQQVKSKYRVDASIMRTADCALTVRNCSHSRVAPRGWGNTSVARETPDPLHFASLSPEHNGETSALESVSQAPALLYGNDKATGRCYRSLGIVTFSVLTGTVPDSMETTLRYLIWCRSRREIVFTNQQVLVPVREIRNHTRKYFFIGDISKLGGCKSKRSIV